MNVKCAIKRNFARRAATYDAHAWVQRYMAHRLLAACREEVAAAGRILEVGCGTGYLTRRLRGLNRRGWLVAVDLDPQVLTRARASLGDDAGVAWLAADAERLVRGSFEVIVANSVFQWFSHPAETLRTYLDLLAPGGCLAFSAMGPGTFRELGEAWQAAAAAQGLANWPRPVAGAFPGWQDWAHLLRSAGFGQVTTEQTMVAVSYPSVFHLLKTIQGTGAMNPVPQIISPRLFQGMLAAYPQESGNGAIMATYDLIWAVAQKDHPGAAEEKLGK